MNRIPVRSTDITSIGHDGETLEVEFKRQSAVYQYSNVDKSLFEEILKAPSIGGALNAKVKRYPEKFPFKLITREEP